MKTLDSLSSEVHRQGVGVSKNSAKVIDPSHEGITILGEFSPWLFFPKVLQRTVFFYVGLNYVLRGVVTIRPFTLTIQPCTARQDCV